MHKLKLVVLGALLAPALALGQVRAGISIDLPVVLPQLVVVQPGVQVVPECDHEVFFTNGYYWAREDGAWYRSRSHRGGWVMMPPRAVPVALVKVPPGHYKHWKGAKYKEPKHGGGWGAGPGPAYRYDDRGHDDDRGHGKHGKHGH